MEKRFIFFQHVLVLLMCAAHSYCLSSTPQPIPIQPIPQAPVLANPPTPTSAAPASTPVAPAAAAASPVVVSDLQKKIDLLHSSAETYINFEEIDALF